MLIFFVLLASLVYIFLIDFNRESGVYARISTRDAVIYLDLNIDGVHKLEDLNIEVLTQNGRIRFYSSDCPDQICVNSGFLGRVGQTAACLPNQTIIVIEGPRNVDDIDVFLSRQ